MTIEQPALDRRTWKHELYDGLLKNSLLGWLEPIIIRDTITIDVGGNTGYQAYWHSQYNNVITFEPVKEVYDILMQNMSNMGVSNIEFRNKAVGSENKKVKLFIDSKRLSMTSQSPLVDDVTEREVDMVQLDTQGYDKRVGFIKIDVEGYELDVLEGASDLIDIDKPHCMVEIYKPWCDKITPAEKYFTWFKDRGYNCFYFNSMTNNFIKVDSVEQGVHAVEKYHFQHDGDFLFTHKEEKGPF